MNVLERAQAKQACYNSAQEIATALDLCYNKRDVEQVLDELEFKPTVYQPIEASVVVNRYEFSRQVVGRAQAQYICPFTGVVYVCDYSQQYVDAVAVLSEHAKRLLLDVVYSDDQPLMKIKK